MDSMRDRREGVSQFMGQHGEEFVLAPARLTESVRLRPALRNVVYREQNQLSALVARRDFAGAQTLQARARQWNGKRDFEIVHRLPTGQHRMQILAQSRGF